MIDTHCHIHSQFFPLDPEETLKNAQAAGVERIICVGVDLADSQAAVRFAGQHDAVSASIGIHPHEASDSAERFDGLVQLAEDSRDIVAIGEIGLDYWYKNSPKDDQKHLLKQQLELGLRLALPFIFHVRGSKEDPHDAFVDFFEIIDAYSGITGVVHSFTAGQKSLRGVLSRSLCVGVNGIATFTDDEDMQAAYKAIPLSSMVLETDAPYLTPKPKRGTVNTPDNMGYTAAFLAGIRGERVEELESATSDTAKTLFRL